MNELVGKRCAIYKPREEGGTVFAVLESFSDLDMTFTNGGGTFVIPRGRYDVREDKTRTRKDHGNNALS